MVEQLETDPTAGPTQIDGIAANIHEIIKEALPITLREVGENVAYTGRTAKGQGPTRRQNQEGFLKDTDKRKYRRLIRLQGQLRSALRHRPKSEQPVPKPQIFLEAENDLKTLLAEHDPETTPHDWWEQTAVGLRTAKTQIKTILRRHDGRRARKKQEKFRDTLRNNPKQAHRYLFESGANYKLDSVKLSTGEVTANEDDVIRTVEKHFTDQQSARVPPNLAHQFPWDPTNSPTQNKLLTDTGGTNTTLGDRYNKEIYRDSLARLPNGKSAGPDFIPNEVLKWLPEQFHDMLHRLFVQQWKHKYKNLCW